MSLNASIGGILFLAGWSRVLSATIDLEISLWHDGSFQTNVRSFLNAHAYLTSLQVKVVAGGHLGEAGAVSKQRSLAGEMDAVLSCHLSRGIRDIALTFRAPASPRRPLQLQSVAPTNASRTSQVAASPSTRSA